MRTKEEMYKSINAIDGVVFHLIQFIALIRNNYNTSSSVFMSFYALEEEAQYQLDLALNDIFTAYKFNELTNAQYLKFIRAIMRICYYDLKM